ncbi:MAG: aminotransferase class V-fold PLP-dependent enzyme [Bacteroidales bacterium]|nr:aminotransferase class V-fold PLP-dependent enzyme [Bacteroidales bacterium]
MKSNDSIKSTGSGKQSAVNSMRVPVYRDAGFVLGDAATTSEVFAQEAEHERHPGKYIYSRYRNPTVIAAEDELISIEGSNWALMAQSGMAAIDIALSIFQEKGRDAPWLFFSEIYGGTNSYIDNVLVKRRGVDIIRFDPSGESYDLVELERLIDAHRPSLIYYEVISNPLLIIADAPAINSIARKYGAAVIIDNTFATPMLYSPLSDGADLVVHSATKYLGGHGNITAGAICGNDMELMKKAIEYRKYTGHMISPDDAYRLHTQMQSFRIRFKRQCENAAMLAALIAADPKTESVLYPGLPQHTTGDMAAKLFSGRGYGAMVTFSFSGSDSNMMRMRRDRFIEAVSGSIRLVPTLGDSHTILMPVEPVWGYKYAEPGMIRLSVGFEEPEYLEEVVSAGLSEVS